MYTNQDARLAYPFRWRLVLEAISIAAGNTMERIRAGYETARREHVVSKLPPHLRYDIGYLDHQPPPLTLRQIERSHRQSLEAARQHFF